MNLKGFEGSTYGVFYVDHINNDKDPICECHCMDCGFATKKNIYEISKLEVECPNCGATKQRNIVEGTKINNMVVTRKIVNSYTHNNTLYCTCALCKTSQRVGVLEFINGATCKACHGKSAIKTAKEMKAEEQRKSKSKYKESVSVKRVGKELDKEEKKESIRKSKLNSIIEARLSGKVEFLGRVYNGLEITNVYSEKITSKERVKCDVKCVYCGREGNGRELSTVRAKKEMCSECASKITFGVRCSNCEKRLRFSKEKAKLIDVPMIDFYSGVVIKCPQCGKEVSTVEEGFIKDITEEVHRATDKLDKRVFGKVGVIDNDSKLMISEVPAYIGRDSIPRYNCWCLTHSRLVILTPSEIEDYNHKECKNSDERVIQGYDMYYEEVNKGKN